MSDQQALEGVNYNYTFRSWEDLSRREQIISMISDDYKSLNGVRPRFNLDHMTDDDLERWHMEICRDLGKAIDEERQQAVKKSMSRQPWSLGDILGDIFPPNA